MGGAGKSSSSANPQQPPAAGDAGRPCPGCSACPAEYCPRGSVYESLQEGLRSPAAAAELTWRRRLSMVRATGRVGRQQAHVAAGGVHVSTDEAVRFNGCWS